MVRQWAPLVWLAPNEQFMPGNVNDFLRFVHAEKSTTTSAAGDHQNGGDVPVEILELGDEYFYDAENQPPISTDAVQWPPPPSPPIRRNKRMFNNKNYGRDFVRDLPTGKRSLNWFLVTNEKIGWFFDIQNYFGKKNHQHYTCHI